MIILRSSAIYGSAVNVENIEINEYDHIEDKIIDSITPEDLNPNIGFTCHITWSIIKTIGYQLINVLIVHRYYIIYIYIYLLYLALYFHVFYSSNFKRQSSNQYNGKR